MSHLTQANLLRELFISGYEVYVANGQLLMMTGNNEAIKIDWKIPKNHNLLIEICKHLKINAYKYTSYSTGFYGERGDQGVSLHFINISTGESSYVIYNANLKRNRKSKGGKKGDNLPKGQFRIGEHHKFYKFWLSTGLNLPPRLSSFHDYMGKLKKFIFTGDTTYKDRMVDKMIPLLHISSHQISNALGLILPDSHQPTPEQRSDNKHTSPPDKDVDQPYKNTALQQIHTTCDKEYGSSIQDGAVRSELLVNKIPVDDDHKEWWESYDNATEL